ncbi:sugar ABC transporter permease [Paenibacillus sp. FSL A5-0031]|uniref:ABC transporter permease n=1 Tax=Paenibacillus sp. FSL A5-0031 TaxID=1920420 RepID=UPI00096D67AE|nr:ABC transporter permease subunit [Paenibacillus sp. FSL A5-0031]OME86068.1 sugar ABC transporter permease [Paenibacillus sp. FSL A5-0031]
MKLTTRPIHNRTLRSVRKQFPFYLMMSPGLLFIAIMCYIPMGGVIIAFKDYNARDGIFGSAWMDPLFKNFEFFFKSETARIVTFNTLFYNIIEMVAVTLGALILAILLSEVKNKKLSATYKGALLLPVFLSWIVVQYIVFGMLSVDRGIVNNVIESYGGEAIYWYSEPSHWHYILPLAYLWKNIGYYSVLYVAAIAGINTDYYEAAQLDGASKWQQVKYVTLPLLKPIIIVLMLLWVGKLFNGGLGDWNGFYTLSNDSGALYGATDVIDTLVFRSLKKLNDYGMSSAIGLYQAVIGLVLVLISNYIIKKTDPDSALF